MICTFENVTVRLSKNPVLKDLSWSLPKGEVIGLLGKNGAGKSTLIRSMLGLIVPTKGTITTLGCTARELGDKEKDKLAYVPQTAMGYESLKVSQALSVHKNCYSRWHAPLAERMLQRFEINPNQRVASLSVGQRQLLMLIFALPTEPEFLVMDEPFASLDPSARRDVLQFVSEVTNENSTLLYSTHITADLHRLSTRIALLADGKIALNEPMDTIDNAFLFIGSPDQLKTLALRVTIIKQDQNKTLFFFDGSLATQAERIQKLNLEEFFIHWHAIDQTKIEGVLQHA